MEINVDVKNIEREGNYLKIELNDEIMRKLGIASERLSDLRPGAIFVDPEGAEYIVLEQESETTAVISKESLKECRSFGDNNNWKESRIRRHLNVGYYSKLSRLFGLCNLIEHTTDLLSLDGLDDYGEVVDRVSLLTLDHYRKFRKILGSNIISSWYLATPNSTISGRSVREVCYVGSHGNVSRGLCESPGGVRPFFILKSSIFVSRPAK